MSFADSPCSAFFFLGSSCKATFFGQGTFIFLSSARFLIFVNTLFVGLQNKLWRVCRLSRCSRLLILRLIRTHSLSFSYAVVFFLCLSFADPILLALFSFSSFKKNWTFFGVNFHLFYRTQAFLNSWAFCLSVYGLSFKNLQIVALVLVVDFASLSLSLSHALVLL